MPIRVAVAVLLTAGTCTKAQELMVVSCSWAEVIAGTNTPVLAPNGVLDPGEGALIQFGMHALRNGTDAIGQVITFTQSGGNVVTGPIRGIGSFAYDVAGSQADATGTWYLRLISPIFTLFPQPGTILEGGARVSTINAVQLAFGGAIVDGTNPMSRVWRGVWTPISYTPRTVHFRVESSTAVPVGQQNSVDVQIGVDSGTGNPIYAVRYFPTNFGPGIDIPINPGGLPNHAVCYPNCDGSIGSQALNILDFMCYINLFAAGNTIANCDGNVLPPVLTANDFVCYMNKYVASCP